VLSEGPEGEPVEGGHERQVRPGLQLPAPRPGEGEGPVKREVLRLHEVASCVDDHLRDGPGAGGGGEGEDEQRRGRPPGGERSARSEERQREGAGERHEQPERVHALERPAKAGEAAVVEVPEDELRRRDSQGEEGDEDALPVERAGAIRFVRLAGLHGAIIPRLMDVVQGF
jgi:hypothetical protein